MEGNFKMLAKCFQGFEDELADELLKLGAMDIKKGKRNVEFVGDKGFLYKANLSLRTALRILKPIDAFPVYDLDDLYAKVRNIKWENYLTNNTTFAIEPTVYSTIFTHSLYVAQKSKDAIADRFRRLTGKRPDVDLENPDISINIHIDERFATISLDSSGDSLHKRGYRMETNIAPINEVLAAGLILKSGWDGDCDFVDPMCGSGTILIEAAMIARNIPANTNRKSFAFMNWQDWDVDLFEIIKKSLSKKEREFKFTIKGYDKAPSAVVKSMANVRNAKLDDLITIDDSDFFKSFRKGQDKLLILFNPPYGERLTINVEQFYGKIGDTLKRGYAGANVWFITSNMDGLKHVGLRPKTKISVLNGKLEAKFVEYEMYEGSRRERE